MQTTVRITPSPSVLTLNRLQEVLYMTTDQTSSPPPPLLVTMRHRRLLTVALLFAASMSVAAQEPVPPTATEYGQWETLGRNSVLSHDGEWLA